MDPVSVISLASAIGGLIDITSRSIVALLDLQARYSRFGLKIRQITGQLSTLKAALNKIKDLILISDDDIMRKGQTQIFALDDEQLVRDLVLSIDCCESVVQVLDEQLDRFQLVAPSQSSGLSNVRTKVKFLWEESEIDDYQGMLNNQINALNLLLTVTQCGSFMEQGNLLRKSSSRLVFEKVQDDSSSVLLQRDKDSFLSRQSSAVDDIGFIDTEFGFERDLFSSKAYRSVARSWMRKSILLGRKQNSSTTITATPPQVNENDSVVSDASSAQVAHAHDGRIEIMTARSIQVDYSNIDPLPNIPEKSSQTNEKKTTFKVPILDTKRLQRRSVRLSAYDRFARRVAPFPSVQPAATMTHIPTTRRGNFLLLGVSASGKSTAMKAIHFATGRLAEYPRPTRVEFTERLVRIIEENAMDEMLEEESKLRGIEQLREQCAKIRLTVLKSQMQFELTPDDMRLIRGQLEELWAQVETRGLVHKLPSNVLDHENSYFLKAIHRVTHDEYIPCFEDTLWNYTKTTGIHGMTDLQGTKIVDVGERRPERKKWIRTFEGVSTLFFFVDIAGYDETLAEDQCGNKMHESLMLFESLCKSRWFWNVRITIIFHFMDKLERKIADGQYPSSTEYQSDREDLRTVDGVRDYFTRRFLELDKVYVGRSISVHYTSIYELDKLGNIFLQHARAETLNSP